MAEEFQIEWKEEQLTVCVSGEEQKDIFYHLNFDGTVEEANAASSLSR